jgi:hypothetical protein
VSTIGVNDTGDKWKKFRDRKFFQVSGSEGSLLPAASMCPALSIPLSECFYFILLYFRRPDKSVFHFQLDFQVLSLLRFELMSS